MNMLLRKKWLKKITATIMVVVMKIGAKLQVAVEEKVKTAVVNISLI